MRCSEYTGKKNTGHNKLYLVKSKEQYELVNKYAEGSPKK